MFTWCLHQRQFCLAKKAYLLNKHTRTPMRYYQIHYDFMVIFIPFFFSIALFSLAFTLSPCLFFSPRIVWNSAKTRYESQSQSQSHSMFVCFYDIVVSNVWKKIEKGEKNIDETMSTNPYNKIEWFASTPMRRGRRIKEQSEKKKKPESQIQWEKSNMKCLTFGRLSSIFNVVIVVTMRFSNWPKIKRNADALKITTKKRNCSW